MSHEPSEPTVDGRVLVLASASPRRAALLALLGAAAELAPTDLDETALPGEGPVDHVVRLAGGKARAARAARPRGAPPAVIVAADTIVTIGGAILGKPVDAADARRMLRTLAGRTHQVITGLAVSWPDPPDGSGELIVAAEQTEVTFTLLSDHDIDWYVATGEPLDKAGAYGIQGAGGAFVASINGSYHNVVGLPLDSLLWLLRQGDFDPRR